MNEYQSNLKPGTIRFHQWCPPPLELGEYAVQIEQTVDAFKGTFTSDFSFSVAGPRFSFNPSEIYSVYPPKGQTGDFANSLPHIVFTRRTLPWERSIIPGKRAESDRLPWMALLVLSADDFPAKEFPDIKSCTVGELINPAPSADFVGPQLKLARYESEKELCNTIDLPGRLFQGIAPSEADLAYLAHVREVNTDHKETLSFLADGWFSVVLANRFPKPEIADTVPSLPVENRAYLVSVEGMKDYLPDNAATTNAGDKIVRLAVLSSWSFNCSAAFTFKDSVQRLKVKRLCIPFDSGASAPAESLKSNQLSDAEDMVRKAYELGYTALNHNTRLGEKTVSWYRGPLVPLYISKQTKYSFLPAPDAAMRYNPLDGMMDVTYAAAYQLGRLLALQDRHFATALHAYRSGVRQQINRVLARKRTESILGVAGDHAENELMNRYLKELDADHAGALPKKPENFVLAKPGDAKQEVNQLRLTTDFDLTIPGSICQWLARLILLYRVPFPYLVPDERMLPPDSMRFFYLDPGWLKCLLEGACSVGRSSSHDELVDEYLRDNFLKLALDESQNVRTRTPAEHADRAHPRKVSENPAEKFDWSQLTGFLMRSPVVKGWQGLEMRAWADSGDQANAPLKPLRIDRLAPDIMLCIFKGKVNRIELKQPPEGMHFGAASDGKGGFERQHLRRLNQHEQSAPGDQLGKDSCTSIPLRNNDAKRVVCVSQLAQDLKGKLDMGREFTSADFGVEMVEGPGRAVFDVNIQETDAQ
jgi:hypothetical protein